MSPAHRLQRCGADAGSGAARPNRGIIQQASFLLSFCLTSHGFMPAFPHRRAINARSQSLGLPSSALHPTPFLAEVRRQQTTSTTTATTTKTSVIHDY
jgi:hypothetical protein